MPIAKIQMPDGRIGRFDVPEGTTPDQVMQFVQSGMQQPEQPQMQDNGATWGAGSNFASGVLQGMGDEVKAAGAALKESAPTWLGGNDGLPFGNAYDQAKTMYQGAREQYAKENPKTAFATDMAGQVAPWLVAAPLMPSINAATLPMRMAQGAGIGAGTGAVSGSLNAEGSLADRLRGGVGGVLVGGAVGGAAVPVIEGATKGATWLANQTIDRLPFRQEGAASRKLAEALMRDGMTPDEAATRLAQMGPDAALMDVGPNTQSLARQAYTVPGDAKAPIRDFLTSRQEGVRDVNNVLQGGQVGRITQQIDNLVPGDFQATREGIAQSRQALGSNYEAAKAVETPVDTNSLIANLDEQLKTAKGGIRNGLAKAREYLFAADGKPDTSVAGLHEAKMAIDDLINGTGDSSIGRTAQSRLKDVQSKLIDAIETAAPDYRVGRMGTAAEWAKSNALESGANFMSKGEFTNPQELAQNIAKMGPEELHNFRVGAAQALKQKVGDLVTRADATKKLMDIPSLEQKIRLAFGDDNMFRQYISGLQNEKQMFDSYGRILGGSRTGEVLAEQADGKVDPSRMVQGLRQIFMPQGITDPVRGVANVVGGIKDRAVMPGPMANNLAQMLTGQDVSPLNQSFQAAQMSEAKRRSLAKLLAEGGGISAGRAQGQ